MYIRSLEIHFSEANPKQSTFKAYRMEWILTNKEWIFSGIGVLIITLIINFFIKRKSKHKQTIISGKGNTQVIDNTAAATKQTIIGGKGNIQNTGNLTVHNNIGDPKLTITLRTLGAASKPISYKFQVGGTGEKEFSWNYEIKIKNESKEYAYNCKLIFPNGSKFNSISKSGKLGTIDAGKSFTVNGKFIINKTLSGYQMKKYREQKYPEEIRDFLIRLSYENHRGDTFQKDLLINQQGEEILS